MCGLCGARVIICLFFNSAADPGLVHVIVKGADLAIVIPVLDLVILVHDLVPVLGPSPDLLPVLDRVQEIGLVLEKGQGIGHVPEMIRGNVLLKKKTGTVEVVADLGQRRDETEAALLARTVSEEGHDLFLLKMVAVLVMMMNPRMQVQHPAMNQLMTSLSRHCYYLLCPPCMSNSYCVNVCVTKIAGFDIDLRS